MNSAISHVSVGANDLDRMTRFYDAVLAPLGIGQKDTIPGFGTGWGRRWPEFWINKPHDGRPANAGNGVHIAFLAENAAQIDAFYAAGLANGGSDNGAPGIRAEYAPNYYAAFLVDPEGNRIEAMCFTDQHG